MKTRIVLTLVTTCALSLGHAASRNMIWGEQGQSFDTFQTKNKNNRFTIISKQPFRGPITVKIRSCQTTLGRGMANKILVEEL